MYCKFCGCYTSFFSLSYFCDFCSNLRRAILLYGHNIINDALVNEIGLSLIKTSDSLNESLENEEKIKKD
jgi:hypothetical protein